MSIFKVNQSVRGLVCRMFVVVGLSLVGCDLENVTVNSMEPPKETENSLESRIAALRWPLSDTRALDVWSGYDEAHRMVERHIVEGNLAQAQEVIETKIQESNLASLDAISDEGAAPGEQQKNLLAARNLAYDYALLWLLTGKEEDAERARAILVKFAEVVPNWPLYSRKNTRHNQDDKAYLQHSEANGLWGRWHPLDLGDSVQLLRAYDILRPVLCMEDRRFLEENLFVYHKRLLEKFTGLWPLYHNLAGYHLVPLIRFGQVLDRPQDIHEAVRYWREMLDYSYSADGFYREVTPDYHYQITHRLMNVIPEMVQGYSDPENYADPGGEPRFLSLDLAESRKAAFHRINSALATLALPDGTYANLNDSWPKKLKPEKDADLAAPGLLGISGVAKLSAGGMTAFLKFGGIRGHDHWDALNLIWFAGGREVFSDTGYMAQPKKDIVFDRAWSSGTASHLTAAIDEESHFADRTAVQVPNPAPRSGFVSQPPPTPGHHSLEAVLPAAARYNNQGRLLVWDAGNSDAQAMEAEQENAYPGKASIFRRTIVMVPLAGGTGYLLDIFRIRGGSLHDFFLRGGLDENYALTVDVPLQPAKGKFYSYIQLKDSGAIGIPTTITAGYLGSLQVRSRLAGVFGTQPVNLQMMLGEAPAIRRTGLAPFSFVRRTSEGAFPPLETTLVWVHEATKGIPAIRDVKVHCEGMDVVTTVEMAGRRDVVFSGFSDESPFALDGWTFDGRLAFASEKRGEFDGRVFSGSELRHDAVIAKGKPRLTGKILSTTRKDDGALVDSVLVQTDGALPDTASYSLAHIDFGNGIRFSIPVESANRENDGLRVVLSHSPGFVRETDFARMTNFPGWRVQGDTLIRLE